jgi:integrase
MALRPHADAAASANAVTAYREVLATNSNEAQRFDLSVFAQYVAATHVIADDPATRADFVKQLLDAPTTWAGLSHGIVAGFIQWQFRQGYAIGTINRRLATVKAYARLSAQLGVLPEEDFARIERVRGIGRTEGRRLDEQRQQEQRATRRSTKKAEPVPISLEQARHLKRVHSHDGQGRRDAVIFCLLLDHGLRCGEIAELTVDNFVLGSSAKTSYMRFYRRKVDKVQTHQLTEDTHTAMVAYLREDRSRFEPATWGPLLCGSRRSGRLTHVGMRARSLSDYVKHVGQRLARDPELGKKLKADPLERLSPHDGRHYWATAAIGAGSDIKAVQNAGGWSSPAMPMRYARDAEIANERVVVPQ